MADPTPPIPGPSSADVVRIATFVRNFGGSIVKFGWNVFISLAILLLLAKSFYPLTPPFPPVPPAPTLTIGLPDAMTGDVGRMISLTATTKDPNAKVNWWCDASGDLAVLKDTHYAVFVAPKSGKYTVLAWTVEAGDATDAVKCDVTVGIPTPPTPPIPPTPPTPPTPIPGEGLHVLIIKPDAQGQTKLPAEQVLVFTSDAIRKYLNDKCALEPDGKTKSFRVWDSTADVSKELPVWKTAFERPHQTLPWIVIGTKDQGFEGPLPANINDTITLLKKFGG